MSKEVSRNMLRSKVKPKKGPKTKDVKTGSLGIGDAYAYGIKDLVDDMKSKQGSSQTSWLGVSKETLNAEEYTDRQELKVKGKK